MEVYLNIDISDPPRYSASRCDSEWIDSICAQCAKHGVQKIFWRVSLGRAYYHSKILSNVDRSCGQRWLPVAKMLDHMDPLAVAVERAHHYGIELWAWWPFSETHVARGDINLIDPFYEKRVDLFWCNKDRSRYLLGHPCLAEPEVQNRYCSIAQELSDYGVDGILLCTRTHCTRPGESRRGFLEYEEDEFGFNSPIVDEYLNRYGQDITRDEFDRDAWHRLKGEYLTKLLNNIRDITKARHQKLWVNVSPDQLRFMSNLSGGLEPLRIYQDWSKWSENDIVDGIVAVTPRSDNLGTNGNVVDISRLKKEVSPEKLYYWIVCLSSRPPNERSGHLRLENMVARRADVFGKTLEIARSEGAQGVICHEMYTVFFTDWSGVDIGLLPDRPEEYWSMIENVSTSHV